MSLTRTPSLVRRSAGAIIPCVIRVKSRHTPWWDIPCCAVITAGLLLAGASSSSEGARVNFTGVDLATVSSPAGQNFTYLVGSGPGTGSVNVRLLSGAITQLTTGEAPDLTGLLAYEHSDNLSPATFRFTFDAPRTLRIDENETLTKAETNAFTLPAGTWDLLSMVNATSNTSGPTISFTGTTYFGPYGHYSISGAGPSVDFTITNTTAFIGLYGSGISIDVLPEPATLSLLALGSLVAVRRKRP